MASYIDWDAPNDGETTSEMLEVLEERRRQEQREALRNARLWENYRDHYGRNGEVVIKPMR